jgi:hypothetical protein
MKWIPCSETLPTPGRVLAWSAAFERDGCRYGSALWIARYDNEDGRWRLGGDQAGCDHAVTHWMPLPDAPGGPDGAEGA